MEISIIIPAFNAEKYLDRCLKSVLAALGEVKGEILVINDRSTDKTADIIRDFAKKYPKIVRELTGMGRGAAAARNFGVREARGEYIWFIDADDAIAPTSIRKILGEKPADLIMFGAKKCFLDGKERYFSAVTETETDFKSRFIRYGMGPWQVAIRRKWYMENGFSFREGIIHEDMEMMSSLILYTDNFRGIDEPLYFYYENPGSVLHKSEFNEHIFDIFPALSGLYERFKDAKAEKKYHDELEWFFIWNLLIDAAADFKKFPEGKATGFLRTRKMLKKYFPSWRKNQFLRQKPLKLRVKVLMNYYR